MNENSELMTISELCEYLKVPKCWVYVRTHRKEIPYIKIGKKVLFKKTDIEKYINDCTINAISYD